MTFFFWATQSSQSFHSSSPLPPAAAQRVVEVRYGLALLELVVHAIQLGLQQALLGLRQSCFFSLQRVLRAFELIFADDAFVPPAALL